MGVLDKSSGDRGLHAPQVSAHGAVEQNADQGDDNQQHKWVRPWREREIIVVGGHYSATGAMISAGRSAHAWDGMTETAASRASPRFPHP